MTSKRYTFNEGTIELPNQWQDQSMNVFVLPDDTGINLVINRTPVPTGLSEEEYYQQVIHQFQHNLKNYREIAQEMISLDDKPAYLLEYQWQTAEGLMYQCTLLQICKWLRKSNRLSEQAKQAVKNRNEIHRSFNLPLSTNDQNHFQNVGLE